MRELLDNPRTAPRYTMQGKKLLQLAILFCKGILIAGDGAECFLQTQDLFFEGFNI